MPWQWRCTGQGVAGAAGSCGRCPGAGCVSPEPCLCLGREQSPGQVPAGHASLTSCRGCVRGFEPLLLCLSPASPEPPLQDSLELGPALRVRGSAFPSSGEHWGGRLPLCHISAPVALTRSVSWVTSELCPWLRLLWSSPCQPQPVVTRQKEKDLRVMLGPQHTPAHVRTC